MELNELLEKLELEEAREFEYFENFADLVENQWDIPADTLFTLFSETDKEDVAEVIRQYFDEMQEGMPDDSTDIFTLIETIKMYLSGLILNSKNDNLMMDFAEEINRFRNWYCEGSSVDCVDIGTGKKETISLKDALTVSRIDRMENTEHRFDFENCLDYEIDEYLMNFADFGDEEDYDESEDLIENGYVYDDEMKEKG